MTFISYRPGSGGEVNPPCLDSIRMPEGVR